MIEEIWKDIEGYEGLYMVSNMGSVKSLNYNKTGEEKILKPCKCEDYLKVVLCKNNKIKKFFIHRLVARAFIDNPDNKPCIDHINTARDDNRVENLRWATTKENNNNVLTRSKRSGANNYQARKVLQFTRDGVFIREWNFPIDAARELDIGRRRISACCRGKQKTAYGFIWKYAEEF